MSQLEDFKRRQAELKARDAAADKVAKAARTERDNAEKAAALKVRKRDNKRAQRQREVAQRITATDLAGIAVLLGDLPPIEAEPERLAADEKALAAWLTTRGREQGALRKLERDTPGTLAMSWRVLQTFRHINESRSKVEGVPFDPGYTEFAERLALASATAWSKDQARRRLANLRKLEQPGGPFAATTRTYSKRTGL